MIFFCSKVQYIKIGVVVVSKHIKILTIFATVILILMISKFYIEYNENEKLKEMIFQEEAKSLNNFIVAFRKVYQNLFIENNIELDDKTINFLPIHSIHNISNEFSSLVGKKVSIRTVSDRPRNPQNSPNVEELKIIEDYKKTKSKDLYFERRNSTILQAMPLYIEKSCLKCHGKKSDAPISIQNRYDKAYDYSIGDLRGIMAIQISKHDIIEKIDANFKRGIFVASMVYFIFILSIYLLIKVIRKNEAIYTEELELKVKEQVNIIKTQELTLFQKSKMASMGEMIGNIAHQWRQPLSTISVSASGMKFQKEENVLSDNTFYNLCDEILKQCQFLSQTIDDFRDFLKTDKTKKNFNLNQSLISIISIVSASLKHNDIEIIYTNNIVSLDIFSYENELSQSILNIVNNAKDAIIEYNRIENRYILIDVNIFDDMVRIDIKDNGEGIKEEIITKIFDPYFTTKHQSQGTGLGLYMTYKIITDSLNGKIFVQNSNFLYQEKHYFGAKFTIEIPIK